MQQPGLHQPQQYAAPPQPYPQPPAQYAEQNGGFNNRPVMQPQPWPQQPPPFPGPPQPYPQTVPRLPEQNGGFNSHPVMPQPQQPWPQPQPQQQPPQLPQLPQPFPQTVPPQMSAPGAGFNNRPVMQPPGPQQPQQLPGPPQPYAQPGPPQYTEQKQQFGAPNFSNFENERRYVELSQERNLFGYPFENNRVALPASVCSPNVQSSPSIFRCTMSAIPETQDMLKRSRMPFGLSLHPFRDMKNLTVIQTSIVRCRACRTYINPYVSLPDHRHWKCNLCFRANDIPDDFLFDPQTRQYGDPRNRPELQCATIEYIAPTEYMLRPPQAALYFYVFDVTAAALESGYLFTFVDQLLVNLDQIPGDDRTQIGFMAYDSCVHFFEFYDPERQPRELILSDVDENLVPVPNGLIVSLRTFKESIRSFIERLPTIFESSAVTESCLGTALSTATKLCSQIGGRVSLFTCSRPSVGSGALKPLDPGAKQQPGAAHTSDFYQRLALECTAQQVSVDVFALNTAYADLSTISDTAKFSSGTVYHFPTYHMNRNPLEVERFKRLLSRYLTRKIGFEAVLRIRCSKGLSLHTFFGNFFIRSTDLLAMPNVNPDAAIAVQVEYEEDLTNQAAACFQAALLYTSSKGDRRIRVHTLCIPIAHDIQTVFGAFDVKATVSLLAKMAAERALTGSNPTDCREALINAAIDTMAAYNRSIGFRPTGVCAPIHGQMKFFVAFVLGLLKHCAFAARGQSDRDKQASDYLMLKSAPLEVILNEVYPLLYPIHNLTQTESPQRLPLSYERVNQDGVYLMDAGRLVLIYVCAHVNPEVLRALFGVNSFAELDEEAPLEQLPNPLSEKVHALLRSLYQDRCQYAPVVVCREDGQRRLWFTTRLVDDRTESAHSYVEFVQHISRESRR